MRGPIKILATAGCILLAFTLVLPVAAQETRSELIAQSQTKKAATLHPEVPSKAEHIFLRVKKVFIESPSGFYPLFGSVYSGGGPTFGAGYRQFYGERTFWDARGLWSIKNYKYGQLSTDSLGHAQNRIDLNGHVGWRDATQVGYYGLGMDTEVTDRANFRFKQTFAGASLKLRPIPWIKLGAGLEYEDYNLEEGLGTQPSIETVYTPSTAPGLGVSPTYLHSTGSAGIDWRPAAGYARRGGLYELRYHNYSDRDGAYSFDRIEAEVVQHFPILRENWVISTRGLLNTTLGDTSVVPYFLMPSLGSGTTLRSYSSWRYRDRHSLLVQGEFRWIPNRTGIDMALFYDTGKVASSRSGLDLNGFKHDMGVEVRFHGPGYTPLRVGIGRGSDGWQLVFGGSAAF